MKKEFPEALIADYRETHPIITQGLDRATTFLSLISLITLIVGALGVASAMNAHLQQKLDSIAIMKCLGARSNQIMRIYILQTLALGLSGGVLGVIAGLAVQQAFPVFLAKYFDLKPQVSLDFVTAGQGMAIGLLATLLFTVPPLLGIRAIKPGLIFRREMAETKPGWKMRIGNARMSIVSGLVILLGIGGIAASLTTGGPAVAWKTGLYFVGALVVSLAFLSGVAWVLLRWLRVVGRLSVLPTSVRHGVANLYRPGNHAQSALVALGVGVMFTLTVYLVQHGVIAEISKAAPPGMPNVFLIDISPRMKDGVLQLMAGQKGVEGKPDLIGTVAAKMLSFDGRSVDDLPLKGFARRFRYTRSVTSAMEKPDFVDVKQGQWWTAKDLVDGPKVAIAEEVAQTLHLAPGSVTEWQAAGRKFTAKVACVQKIDSIHLVSRVEFIFSPGALDGIPVIYYGSLRAVPKDVPQLQISLYKSYPTVTVMNMADVLQTFQGVVDQISTVIRFISLFAILAGAIILASSVAGTRFRRVREVVILKTLGATRWRVSRIFSVEFLILGGVAGLMGTLLANGFANLLLNQFLQAKPRFDWLPSLICVGLTAFIANAAGWLASFRILGQKPLEVLREE